MAVDVRVVSSDDDLRVARTIDLSSFSLPFVEAAYERDRHWLGSTTTYVAEDDGVPAGTCRAHAFELTVPGGTTVPLSGVGDLGVLAGHRRRGVLRAMMDRLLGETSARGRVAAGLYASDSTIYGRFGFGPATRARYVRIETARTALRSDVTPGRGGVRVVTPADAEAVVRPVHERAVRRRPGGVGRSDALWKRHLAPPADGTAEQRLCLAHIRPDGSADAYALYTVEPRWRADGARHRLEVEELIAESSAAELAMWRAVLDLDLVRTVEARVAPDCMLDDAVADRWALATTGGIDVLWVRLLDIAAALSARRYRMPGRLVLEVADPDQRGSEAPSVAGTWELEVGSDGSAEVTATGTAPDLRVGVAELGSVWLGGGSVTGLAAVGRATEVTDGAAGLADALFGWSPLPWVTQEF